MPVGGRITLVQFGPNANSAVPARYLSGILREHGFETTIVCVELSKQQGSGASWDYGSYDLDDESIGRLFEVCAGSLLVGFTVYSFVAHIVKKIYLSERNPGTAPLVVGGPHATLDPYHVSHCSDYVCVGDGELSIVELSLKLAKGELPSAQHPHQPVAENVYSSALLRKATERHTLVGRESPLDSHALPDYSFASEYYISRGALERIDRHNASEHVDVYATFFSRGCVNNCTFCGHETIAQRSGFKKRIKAKDVSLFMLELEEARRNLPWIKKMVFFDPNILSNKRETLEVLAEEYRRRIGLPLSVTGFTFNQINEKIYRGFLNAGMTSVIFGVESACDKTRIAFNRRESKTQILRIDELNGRLKQEYPFSVQYDVIVDSPWESADDALESLAFIARLRGYDYLDIFSLRLFPGTRLFQKALDEGILRPEDVERDTTRVYRSLNCTYENFLLVLIRDVALREGRLFRVLTAPGFVRVMRAVFTRWGSALFVFWASRLCTALVDRHKKTRQLWLRARSAGFRKTCLAVKRRLFAGPRTRG